MTDFVLETVGLGKRYGRHAAIASLDLSLEAGGTWGLVGANGAGKTTLFRILLGFAAPTAGRSFLLGCDSTRLRHDQRARIGFANEQHCLPGWATVERLTRMARSRHPHWDEEIFRRALTGSALDPKRRVRDLSRGQRATFNLALTLARRPELLLLDEPTLGLDIVARRSFLEALLYSEATNHSTIVYCSHHVDEIERVCDRLVVMEQGRLRLTTTPEELCADLGHWISNLPFAGPPEAEIPGLLYAQRIDGLHHHIVSGQGAGFGDFLRSRGASTIRRQDVDLASAISALLRSAGTQGGE
jgi:ABC-2 type transport system ATP-binding protein